MKFSESLKKNEEFKKVYEKGKSLANRHLIIYVLRNELKKNRVGISVSKKVGNSVVRHRVTRLIRECYRISEEDFKCGYDIVIIARTTAKELSFKEIKSALLHLKKLHDI